jgi:hypothetical protein
MLEAFVDASITLLAVQSPGGIIRDSFHEFHNFGFIHLQQNEVEFRLAQNLLSRLRMPGSLRRRRRTVDSFYLLLW